MIKKVTLPPTGQIIEIDEDATDEEINQAATMMGWDGSTPLEVTVTDDSPPETQEPAPLPVNGGLSDYLPDMNTLQGVAEGGMKVFNNAARALEYGAEAIGLDDPNVNDVGDAEAVQQEFFDSTGYQGTPAGQFIGEVGATLPLMALPGGAFAQGAAGAALTTDARDPMSIGAQAVAGGALGKLGEKAFQGAANALSPQLTQFQRILGREGVEMTPGQLSRDTSRNAVAVAEDQATSLPIVGPRIGQDRERSVQTMNRAAIQRALTPIGETLPADKQFGRRAIKYAGDKLSEAYDSVLPRMEPFVGDDTFLNDLGVVQEFASEMLPERAKQLNNTLDGLGRFFEDGKVLDGAGLKAIETRLGKRIRDTMSSTDADQRQLGEGFEMALESIRDLAARKNPDLAEELGRINKGYASLVQVERAGLTSKQLFSPAGYSQSVKMTENTTRRRGYARGDALNQDLSDAASEILPSEVPDSGTFGRSTQSSVMDYLVGGGKRLGYEIAKKTAPNPNAPYPTSVASLLANSANRAALYAPVGSTAIIEGLRNVAP